MRVIHSLSWYFPDYSGGTETYVSDLIASLSSRGVENKVVAAREGSTSDEYSYDGVEVYRYPVEPNPSLDQIRGLRPYGGFDKFKKWLSQQDADVYHQHSLIGGCGIDHLRAARELGFKTILTVHLASAVCLRGTMMLNGDSPCDGEVYTERCGVCWGMGRGISPGIARLMARLPLSLSQSMTTVNASIASAISTRALVLAHQHRLREVAALSDRVIAISDWLYDALLANGFSELQLVSSHTGGPSHVSCEAPTTHTQKESLRVGYFGRWDRLKGVDLLVRAVKSLPSTAKVELTIHGLPGNQQEADYRALVEREAFGDPRIKFAGYVPKVDMLRVLQSFDVIAIPSQLLETGPLIALEAHGAKVPIVASNLGGLAERIRDGVDGLLVPATDEAAWSSAILSLSVDRELLNRLRNGILPIRTMDDVAQDMSELYREVALVNSSTSHAA